MLATHFKVRTDKASYVVNIDPNYGVIVVNGEVLNLQCEPGDMQEQMRRIIQEIIRPFAK